MGATVKKTAWILGGAAIATALFMNCGGDSPERLYDRVLKRYGPVISNSAKADEKKFTAAADALRAIVATHRTWARAADVQLVLGGMYAGRRQFDDARAELEKVYVDFPEKREQCARALFLRGIIFEEQGDWKSAAKEFEAVMGQYRDTRTGLEVPMYVAAHYRHNNMDEAASQAYDRAIRNYLYIIEDNPYGGHIPLVERYLMAACAAGGKWEKTVTQLEKVAAKFPDSEGAALSLYYAAAIYSNQLDQPQRAEQLLQGVIKDFAGRDICKRAELSYLSLLAGRAETDRANELLAAVTTKYQRDASFCAAARFGVAAGFDKAGRWDQALVVYRELQAKNPESLEALRAHLAVAYHFMKDNQPTEAAAACSSAVTCGRKLLAAKPSRQTAIETYKLMSTAFSMQKKWQEGLAVLDEFIGKYPQEQEAAAALFQAGNIYHNELQDNAQAREKFALLVQRFPDNQLTPVARALLEEMDKAPTE
jgi:outer membrane protein assembly factor BamD (BamD/ComL family)